VTFDHIDLTGMIDLHIHGAPDVRPRKLNDIEIARQAASAGMKAIVLKSHVTLTADRATLVEAMVPGVRVFGGLALNHPVGGINPSAVEMALKMGAAQIWMPTLSSSVQRHTPMLPGIALAPDGAIVPAAHEVLELIASYDAILGTGHLSVAEIELLLPAARQAGVKKILVTHPEHPPVEMPPDRQRELARKHDVLFERCFISTPSCVDGKVPFDRLAQIIRDVGPESTIISTDLGQTVNAPPVEGFASYVDQLLAAGFTWKDVRRMGADNPATLLGVA
jgi:hypothetical protein